MPDVGRSDSQRSQSSQRPRVSFNRDVHVKRIGHAGAPRVVGALAGDGEGHLVPAAVRRERPSKLSRRELAQEARRVLAQADSVVCSSHSPLNGARFSTLPPLRSRKSARRSLSFREPSKKGKDKDNSSSLTDLVDDSVPEPPKRSSSFKKSRTQLVRSKSDAAKSSEKVRVTNNTYASLERPTRKKNRSHSDQSDRSPSPSAVRQKRNILKKSHSDSESVPLQELFDNRKKKQLSPIIEASPRDDYFVPADVPSSDTTMLHSSQQPPSRPALTRGRTVESMVKRLSQDARTPRRPPRGVSPSALLSPGDERRHNNNLPFSYTEPASPTGAAPTQVIYAEVVVSGGGPGQGQPSKQTVHTAVPLHSDEDEGLGLTMERHGSTYLNEYKSHETRYESGDYAVDSSGRGRADGMDARRKDLMLEDSRYDDGYFQPRNGDIFESSIVKNVSEFHSDSRILTDKGGYYGRDTGSPIRKEPPIQPHIINTGDLSSRRDRLESRIESQRKERFASSRLNENSSYIKQDVSDSRIIDSNKKYPSDPRINSDVSYNNRRDFLNSQIDHDRDPIRRDIRHENERNHNGGRFVEMESYNKKDLFADSGIEVDYRKESSGSNFKKYESTSNVKPNDGLTAKILINSPQVPNVTRVDLNGRTQDRHSDDEELDEAGRYYYKSSRRKANDAFTSTRLVQEQRRTTEVVPTSSVLIRHYTPTASKKREDNSISASEQLLNSEREAHREVDEHDSGAEETKEPSKGTLEKGKVLIEEKSKKSDVKKISKKKQVSAMDKVKQLFSRSGSDTKTLKKNKKKKEDKSKEEKVKESEEDPLTSRYTEYKGSNIESDQETLTPLSHQQSPRSYRRHQSPAPQRDYSPSRQREHSPPRHRDRSLPRDRNFSPSHQRDRLSPPQHRDHHSPLHHRDHSPAPNHSPAHYRDHSPSPFRGHHRDKEHHPPSPHLGQHRDHSSSPPRGRHRDHSPQPSYTGLQKEQHRRLSSDTEEQQLEPISSRQRLATPTPSPCPPRAAQSSATLTRINNNRNKEQNGGSWFKSLDRLTKRGKSKPKVDKDELIAEDEITAFKQNNNNNISNNNKNLRFFGDTDQESVTSIPPPMPLQSHRRYKSNSNMMASSNKLQVPRGTGLRTPRRHHRSAGDVATSSAESTTEGDSSQQSQRSIVYLHAATVGDIPVPLNRGGGGGGVGRRAQSREELSSVTSSQLQPQTRTISRSISVLAPWKPRHYRDGMEVHYNNEDNNKNYIKNNGKPPKVPVSQQTSLNSSTMNRINRRKNAENKTNHTQKQRVGKATSIESLSQKSVRQNHDGRNPTKKKSLLHPATSIESLSHKSSHSGIRQQIRDKNNSKKNSSLNASAMELNTNNNYKNGSQKSGALEINNKKGSSKVSRSASMPKDTRVTAGWFKLRNKKQGT